MPAETPPLTLAEKRARLAEALRRKAREPIEAPLSFSQQRLWFVDQIDPGSPLYNITVPVRVVGMLQPEILQRVTEAVVERHEPLRTTFGMRGSEPVQRIAPRGEVHIDFRQIDDCPGVTPEDRIERLVREQTLTRFDLARGPLMRLVVVRVKPEEHIVCCTTHHIISDGWSVGVVLFDLAALYSRESGRRAAPLRPLTIQYRDFARWQTERLSGKEMQRLMSYWRDSLHGAPHTLDLPTDRPRPDKVTYRGTVHRFSLPPTLLEQTKRLSRLEQTTWFVTMLAGYATLLYRYSGQDDMLIGVPISGRERPETQPLVGYFVNIAVARADLRGNPPFRELLGRLRKRMLEVYSHQDIPFEKLVEALQPKRLMDRNPLVQVVYLHQSFPMPDSDESPGLRIEPLDIHPGFSRFELGLRTEQYSDRVECLFEYNTDLFDEATIRRMADHFRTILEQVTLDPSLPIDRIPLLNEAERSRLAQFGNLAVSPGPAMTTLHEAWRAQAASSPHQLALQDASRALTRADLNDEVARIRAEVSRMSLEPEARIGLFLAPSWTTAAGLLGILSAGAVCVPLRGDDPPGRQQDILRKSGAAGVLTPTLDESRLASWASAVPRERILAIAEIGSRRELAGKSSPPAPSVGLGSQLAGVWFDTGSVDGPLGTLLEHRQLLCSVQDAQESWGWQRDWRHGCWALESGLATLTSVLLPLLTGGSVQLLPSVQEDPSRLAQFGGPEGWDVLHLPADQLPWLLNQPEPILPRHTLMLMGERASAEWIRALRALAPELRVVHVWQRPEIAGGGLAYELPRGPHETRGNGYRSIPLGRPMANTQALVLHRGKEPTPIGVAGDLYLAGVGLARGYLAAPDANADFVTLDTPLPGGLVLQRAFRTGIRARFTTEGTLVYLGRDDGRVEIHGYLADSREVNALLRQHPQVTACAVVAFSRPSDQAAAAVCPGDPPESWVAYVVVRPGVTVSVDDLRDFLRERLPSWLLPAALLLLDRLPILADGQLDRDALPVPERLRGNRRVRQLPPRTATERALVQLWEQLLGIDRVGIEDDFFELGGNSLMAMQLVNALRDRSHADIPLRALFAEPTIARIGKLLDEAAAGEPACPAIPRAPGGERIPLTPSQHMLWVMEQFDRSTAFNALVGVRLDGPFHADTLAIALQEVMRRHQILQAAVVVRDGRPELVPPANQQLPLITRDLRACSSAERDAEALRVAEQATLQRFDLSAGYAVQFLLLRTHDTRHLLFCVAHHMICDGWSFPILWHETAAIYDAHIRGLPCPLPEPAIQFADFAYWHSQRQDDERREQSAYWAEHLRPPLPVLELATDAPRSTAIHSRPDVCELEIPAELAHALIALGKQEGATAFMTLLAAYVTLLHRYARQDEILVGTPMANRLRPETRDLIGFFASMLPLRCDVSGNPTFLELLARIRRLTIEAFARSEPDWTALAPAFQAPQPGRMPICQAFFTLGEFPEQPWEAGGLVWQPFQGDVARVSGFDLVLALREYQGGFKGAWLYRPDLFHQESVERMRDSFLELVRGIAASPAIKLGDLPLLSAAQRHRLLEEWNGATMPLPRDGCLVELFEVQVARTPAAVAVLESRVSTTYAELNRMANALAQRLRAAGIGPEKLVAVRVDRGAPLIAALLAVWKAGGAYLPLDPAWPMGRVEDILRDAGVSAVVTQARREAQLAALLPTPAGVPVFTVDDLRQSADDEAEFDHNQPRVASSRHLAYVIYTSGSTGPPKGVMVEHHSVLNVVTSFCQTYSVSDQDRVLQQASVAFDVSINEMFPALTVGGMLVVPGQEEVADFESLADWIARHGVSIMAATPKGLVELNRRAERLRSLRLVLSGGEALSQLDVDRLVEFATVTNGYGPTETTVCATYFDLREPVPRAAGSIPIGRPLPNYQIYIVDPQLRLVPIGVAGELCIAGAGLARGYLHDPELTQQKFVANPFVPGQRLYRTGDEARWLPDGNIEFLGRLDRQIKIRGFRVELGEVETVLRRTPGVRDAVVLHDHDHQGHSRLVAYICADVAAEQAPHTAADIRQLAAKVLPEHMIPAVIMFIAEIPLTANGKVDTRRLPVPRATRPELDVACIAPRTPTESVLAEIWREALALDQVGVLDNFFQLGGHSLLAAQIMHQVQQRLEVAFPYRLFFEAPSIDQMARRIDGLRAGGTEPATAEPTVVESLVPLHPIGEAAPCFCFHSLGGHIHEYGRLARVLGESRPVFGIQSRALLDFSQEYGSWSEMAAAYAQVVQAAQGGPYELVGHSAGGILALAVAHALEQSAAPVRCVTMIDSYWQLDEVAVVRGAEQELSGALRETVRQFAPQLVDSLSTLLENSPFRDGAFFHLSGDERVQQIDAWISQLPLLPPGMADHLRNQLRLYERHRALLNAYELPRIAAPLRMVWAREALPGTSPLPRFDWTTCTGGETRTCELAATHWGILVPPAVNDLAAQILGSETEVWPLPLQLP